MCGRLNQHLSAADIKFAFGTDDARIDLLTPNYNIPPSSQIYGVVGKGPRRIETFRWGLVPPWAKEPNARFSMHNARADGVASKCSFTATFRTQRILIPADGFYEWHTTPGGKQPFYIYRRDETPLAFAGLWDCNELLGLSSCTIVTTDANEFMSLVHHRMPVVLEPEDWDIWLDPENDDVVALQNFLKPAADRVLSMHAVHPMVGNPRNKSAEVVAPL
jgi:putative SOS response-associated peptidase YedK